MYFLFIACSISYLVNVTVQINLVVVVSIPHVFRLFHKDVLFAKHYNDSPAVLVSANHSTNGGNLNPAYNSISAWAEVRYCLPL